MTLSEAPKQLFSAWLVARETRYRQWNRTLLLGEYASDRSEKVGFLVFEEGPSIYSIAKLFCIAKVGSNTWIGPLMLGGSGNLSTSSLYSITAGVQIYPHDSVKLATSGSKSQAEGPPAQVDDNHCVRLNLIAGKSINVGRGCIIGANSLALDGVPANSKALENPCRSVGIVGIVGND